MRRISSLLLLMAVLLCSVATNAVTKKILVVGNSFSYDATLQEFLPIVESMGDDIVLGFPYKGGTTLQLHSERMASGEVIYNYYLIKGGKMTSTGGSSRAFSPEIIASQPWDVVVIQTDHNYSGAYQHYFPYLDNIIAYIKEHLTNPDARFYLYMTWAYQDGSAKMQELVKKGYYKDQADQYAKILDCAFRAAEQSGIGSDWVIPGGTAVQNGRTSYIGDFYNRDGYHMDLGHGRYTVALTWYEKIFGRSALDVPYYPAAISEYCADMCRHAAHAAILDPTHVTSLADDFGEIPEVELPPVEPSYEDPWDGYTKGEPAKDGSGYYVVRTGAELAWIAQEVNSGKPNLMVRLGNDIDLGGKPWTPIGWSGNAFNGILDGQGHKINNFYINRGDLNTSNCFAALISYTNSTTAHVRNLSVSGTIDVPANMTVKAMVGTFIGKANALGSLTNCHSDVTINVMGSPGYVGGLVGFIKNINMRSCSYSGDITITGKVTNGVGGLVGTSNSSVDGIETLIQGCAFTGSITNKGSKTPLYAAGINAYSNNQAGSETVTNNYVTGAINTNADNKGMVCGLSKTPHYSATDNYCVAGSGITQLNGAVEVPMTDFHSGRIAYVINGYDLDMFFGQDLSSDDNLPCVYSADTHVYRTIFNVDGKRYAELYSNARLRFPEPPADNVVWTDDQGREYADGDMTDSDLDLYVKNASSVIAVSHFQSDESLYYDLYGRRVNPEAMLPGIYIAVTDGHARKIAR